jgi:hypothetical protein
VILLVRSHGWSVVFAVRRTVAAERARIVVEGQRTVRIQRAARVEYTDRRRQPTMCADDVESTA